MDSGIRGLEQAYGFLLTGILIVLAVLVMLCLVRAIIGPRIADRIVSVNMMGTMVIVIIAVLALMLGEGYLADICVIYAMISFLAVIVLTKVYMGVYMERKEAERIREAKQPAEAERIREAEQAAEAERTGEAEQSAEAGRTGEAKQPAEAGRTEETDQTGKHR